VKIIGLAGESGTGKTMIGEHMAARGAVHIDADRVGHELLAGDPAVIAEVRGLLGDGILDADGRIDRRRVGEIVFADDDARASFNAIIHPAIRRRCGELVEEARRDGAALVVVDAALLLESKMPFAFDLLIALKAPRAVQIARLRGRGGHSDEEIRARLESQNDIEKSFYKADLVVDTDTSREDVLAEIDRAVDELTQ